MRRAVRVLAPGTWCPETAPASVSLRFHDRHRRRIRMTDEDGAAFLLDLSQARLLGEGDGLELEGGGIIAVQAAAEPVADIACVSPAHAARIAWHIGNRHTPLQVLEDGTLRILDDHVLVTMAERLGAKVVRGEAVFAPEPGAYDTAQDGGHGHAH